MSNPAIPLPPAFQTVVDRFVAACAADQRVLAAFLGGSYATGAADEHSDLDLGLITTDEAYDEFMAGREGFIRLLGERRPFSVCLAGRAELATPGGCRPDGGVAGGGGRNLATSSWTPVVCVGWQNVC